MALPSDNGNLETSGDGTIQYIAGKNVVGSIRAEGSAQVTISQINYNQLSELEEERERQRAELDVLQKAIAQKYVDLNRLVDTPTPATGNPYLFVQPFGFKDHGRFFGRDNEIAELFEHVTRNVITFLGGNSGTGKTSLLRAGLTPVLLKQKHLPLVVSLGSEPLEASIKKQLLPNLEGMQFLKTIALTEFLRMVTGALPDGKMLFVLVDDFEEFFNDKQHSLSERNAFYNEWQRCFNGATVDVHWLFCIPSNLQHLLNFFKREVQPNPNTISLAPFDRDAARAAILKPVQARGIQVDDGVVESILDILGCNNIDPASLQLVCFMLAGGRGAPNRAWTVEYYVAQGKADGILRDYLDRTIEELEPREREPAWHVLAVLADPAMRISTEEQLVERLELYDVEEPITRRVLVDLESNNLIERGAAFRLASDSLLPRIKKWKEMRSVRERAREEAIEQIRNIRNSALRGLLGGVFGFIGFDALIYREKMPDPSYTFFKIMLDVAIGALAGLLVVFVVDVAVASYSGPRKSMAYLGGALGGALAFGLALILYCNLIYLGLETFLAAVPRAILEGGLWGAAAGMGIAWALKSQRPYWMTLPACILISGLTLVAMDSILFVLRTRFPATSFITIGMAGAALPAFISVAAIIGGRKFH